MPPFSPILHPSPLRPLAQPKAPTSKREKNLIACLPRTPQRGKKKKEEEKKTRFVATMPASSKVRARGGNRVSLMACPYWCALMPTYYKCPRFP